MQKYRNVIFIGQYFAKFEILLNMFLATRHVFKDYYVIIDPSFKSMQSHNYFRINI